MKSISKIIRGLYLALFFITPFLFTFFNSELFELPKMYFVYLLTTIIITLHLINWVRGQTSLFKKSFLDIPLFLFLISQIICTFTSIDIHTSLYGYYSRLNGGLLSVFSYILLYWALIPYLDDKFKNKIIDFCLFSGFLVSIFGILEHLGIDKHLWVQDVQSRVFSTLGQPNWLAAYIDILIPFSIFKLIISSKFKHQIYFLILTSSFYSCLLFTKSKSGIIASLISIFVFFVIYFIFSLKNKTFISQFKKTLPLFLIIIFASLLFDNPIKDILFPPKVTITLPTTVPSTLNITSSEDIRKIVWKGSLDLFKKYPIFGTGVETFAYSYYWTRPVEHNLTSEWDFLYNKAHNEYLNYLATTGLVGSIAYLLVIIFVLVKLTKNIISQKDLFSVAVFTSYLSILITNIAGFSVVIISLFFFLIPSFVSTSEIKPVKINRALTFFIPVLLIVSFLTIKSFVSGYLADIFYAKSQSSDEHQDYQVAYKQASQSLSLNPNEPLYLIQLATLSSKMALITKDQTYINQAVNFSTKAIQISPTNTNLWKERAQIYYYLASLDIKYFRDTIQSMLQAIKLAPTDAKNYYSLGQFLDSASLVDDAIPYYQKAIELKSNYDYAYFALGQIYFNQKKYDLAKQNLLLDLKYAPTDTNAQDLLKKIENK
jgi:O-antigen ligase/cytochrome c-type biogenesis protein CcmH/NrfG